jgi:hypothetical protein
MKATRIASVSRLRPKPSLDAELDWVFNRAECDMGDQSNYLAMLGPLGPGSAIPSPEDAAEAAHRARRIRGWLRAMDSSDAGVLQCAYELRAWPVELWDAFGRLTGVVVRLACALDVLPEGRWALQVMEMARADWLVALCPSASVDTTLIRLRREAQARFARAHDAYRVTRGDASLGRSS